MSGGAEIRMIVTCSCGHELLQHFHHHRADPQPCQVAGCGCVNFDGYKCDHDGWVAGCASCAKEAALANALLEEQETPPRMRLLDGMSAMELRLSTAMNALPEVEWDRWAVRDGFGSIFGWVDRTEEAELWVETARTRISAIQLAELLESRDDEDMVTAVRCIYDLCEALEGLPLRRDFIVLAVEDGYIAGFTTSSAKLSDDFNRRLGLSEEGHIPCRRVEDDLPAVERAVRL